jgi:hypothetical protein
MTELRISQLETAVAQLQKENAELHTKLFSKKTQTIDRLTSIKELMLLEMQALISKALFLKLHEKILRIETQSLEKNGVPNYVYADDPEKSVSVFQSGVIFEGYIEKDKFKTGISCGNNKIMEGDFKDGKLVDGICVFDGDKFQRGRFVDGKLVEGIYIDDEDCMFKGSFVDGILHRGTYLTPSGFIQNGLFAGLELHDGCSYSKLGFTTFYKNGKMLDNADE